MNHVIVGNSAQSCTYVWSFHWEADAHLHSSALVSRQQNASSSTIPQALLPLQGASICTSPRLSSELSTYEYRAWNKTHFQNVFFVQSAKRPGAARLPRQAAAAGPAQVFFCWQEEEKDHASSTRQHSGLFRCCWTSIGAGVHG